MNPDHGEWNAAAQRDDPTSVLAHYRRLIALRHENPVVALGDFTMLLPEHEHVYAFTRALDGEVLLVVCNVGATPYRLADLLPEALDAELVLGNLPDPGDTPPPVGGPGPAGLVTSCRRSSCPQPWPSVHDAARRGRRAAVAPSLRAGPHGRTRRRP